ncbi:hypothetical protein BGZ80_000959, partial [Entomortierella chlamydospora]
MSGFPKSSGLVTPPLTSPFPIQNSKTPPTTNNNSWKTVGSPPRPLLSPPSDRTRGSATEDTNVNNIDHTQGQEERESLTVSSSASSVGAVTRDGPFVTTA